VTKESRAILIDAAVRQIEASLDVVRAALADELGATAPPIGCHHAERIELPSGGGQRLEMCQVCGVQIEAGVVKGSI
jgi:hypothetical protein